MLSILSVIIGSYLVLILLIQIPSVQSEIGAVVARELRSRIGSDVTIGKVDIGLLNRIIISNLSVKDHENEEIAKVSRLSAKFDILPLFNKKIVIGSVQLFGFDFNLSRKDKTSPLNIQYIIDAFKSDRKKEKSLVDLKINIVLIRRGKLSYDVESEPPTADKFDANHIDVQNIIANISLKALKNDSIDLNIKKISFKEQSGIDVNKLSVHLLGGREQLVADNFLIQMKQSEISIPRFVINYDDITENSLDKCIESARFSAEIVSDGFYLSELAFIVPQMEKAQSKFQFRASFSGGLKNVSCDEFRLSADNDLLLRFKAGADFSGDVAYVACNLSQAYINGDGINSLFAILGKDVPASLANLNYISVKGDVSGPVSNLTANSRIVTPFGEVEADGNIFIGDMATSFRGNVNTEHLHIGKLLRKKAFGDTAFNLDISAVTGKNIRPKVDVKGMIGRLYVNSYNYENIELAGLLENDGFNGHIVLNDNNGYIAVNGSMQDIRRNAELHATVVARDVHPDMMRWTANDYYRNSSFSGKVLVDMTGKTVEDMNGTVEINGFSFESPLKTYSLESFAIEASSEKEEKRISIKSDFMTADVRGNFSYRTLPQSVINIAGEYLPALVKDDDKKRVRKYKHRGNNITFSASINNTMLASDVFNIPVYLHSTANFSGYMNEDINRYRLEGYIPDIRFKNKWFESTTVIAESTSGKAHTMVRSSLHMKNDNVMSWSFDATAKDNLIESDINWGNNKENTYCGKLDTRVLLDGSKEKLNAMIKINESNIVFNDSVWTMFPSEIRIDSGKIHVNDFVFGHDRQHLKINGIAGSGQEDSLSVDLKGIDIAYIFDIADIKKVVDLSGLATGRVVAGGVLKNPDLSADLYVENFSLNGSRLGDMNLKGGWDNSNKAILLDGYATDYDKGDITVKGVINPLKPNGRLDLRINTNNVSLGFLQFYMASIASGVKGRASGNVRIFGPFKEINLEGDVLTHNASFKVDILNTTLNFSDSVHFRPGDIQFRNVTVTDEFGNKGLVNGNLYHEYLKNLSYKIKANLNNMLVLNTKESPDSPFYGTIYATGNLDLQGDGKALNVGAWMKTEKNSTFAYLTETTTSAAETNFITFVDRTPKSVRDTIVIEKSEYEKYIEKSQDESKTQADIKLNLVIDATPDAEMKIIMDPRAGDYIGGRGTGNIRVEFFNKGEVKLFGNYVIDHGIYKFSLQDVIRKDFIIGQGSRISFNGHPLNADLNIDATYTVNSASLYDLGNDVAQQAGQNNVKVNCLMKLTGNLTKPNIQLGLELPNESEEVERTVLNAISTDELMNMEILYLLGLGKFYTPDYANTGQSTSALSSVISSTLSEQFNNTLSAIIDNSNWNIGTNLSTSGNGWTDMEFEGMLSGQLLNNRLLINGNFGYRENSMTQSNFIGDFDIEYLLTRDGGLRVKAYNKTNDRYYTRTTLTTQGIGFVYKKDFLTWKELVDWLLFKKNRQKQAEKKDTLINK